MKASVLKWVLYRNCSIGEYGSISFCCQINSLVQNAEFGARGPGLTLPGCVAWQAACILCDARSHLRNGYNSNT